MDSESGNSRQPFRLRAVEVRQAPSPTAVRFLHPDRVWIRRQQEIGAEWSTWCYTLFVLMLESVSELLPLGWGS